MGVDYEVVRGVAWMTINRPQARNALSREIREGLWACTRRFKTDDTAAVLVITGAGDKAFCAGVDLKEMAHTSLLVPPVDFIPQFGRNIEIDKPIIAAVNGAAYAGGFLLAQQCDMVIAADHAQFAVSEVKVGRGSPWAAPLSWLIPARIAMELLITGDSIDAQRAFEVGLVNRIVPAADLQEHVQRVAEAIAANAPLSVRAAKRTVYQTAQHGLNEAYRHAEELWAPVYQSRDALEGPAAFRDKRQPMWQGK